MIVYSSKTMKSVEQNYTLNDQELLGSIKGLQKAHYYMEGSSLTVFMDVQVPSHFFKGEQINRKKGWWLKLPLKFVMGRLMLSKCSKIP